MNSDTPGDRRGQESPSLRTTDFARVLLRRAELALAALAVPVALAVGVVVAGTERPMSAPVVSEQVALRATSEVVGRVEPTPATPNRDSASGSAQHLADEIAVVHRPLEGTLAGLAALSTCWLLLGTAGTIWRRRLDARDLRDWDDNWARVEPLWSDRPS